MKRFSTFFFFFVFLTSVTFAATYYSKTGQANANSVSSWSLTSDGSGATPANFISGDIFVIQSGHTMTSPSGNWTISGLNSELQVNGTLNITGSVAVAFLTVQYLKISVTGILNINSGSTLIVNNGAIGNDLVVDGTINNLSSILYGPIIYGSGATGQINGTYDHQVEGDTIPTFNWGSGSTCRVSGIFYAANLYGLNQNFYNFTYDCINSQVITNFNSQLTNISGLLKIQTTGGGGSITLFNSNNAVLNVGEFSIAGGTINFSPVGSGFVDTIRITKDGGSFSQGAGSSILTQGGPGAFHFTNDNQFGYTSGTIGGNIGFRVSKYFTVASGMTTTALFVVDSGATLYMQGSGTINGIGSFNLKSGSTLKIENINGITSSGATGAIQVTGSRTYSIGGSYEYSGSSAQNTGSGLPPLVRKLTINNSSNVTLTNSLIINDSLTLVNGEFAIGTNTLTLNGDVSPFGLGYLTSGFTGTVIYNSSFNGQNIIAGGSQYGNLTFNNFDKLLPKGLLKISGIFITGLATAHSVDYSDTIEFNGSNLQTIPVLPGAVPYANIIVNKFNSGVSAEGAITLNGDLTLLLGNLSDNGYVITVHGNLYHVNGYHSSIGGGRILLTGGSSKHLIADVSLGTLEINDPLGASTTGSPSINNLILTNGILSLNHTLNISAVGSISATTGNLNETNQVIFNGDGVVTGTIAFDSVQINGAVNFGMGSTISGVLEIITGGSVALGGAPTYGPASTLKYSIDGTYNRGEEWSSTVGAGYPHSVELYGITQLNLGANAGTSTPRQIAGDLIVDISASLTMNDTLNKMSAPLTVLGNANIRGSLILSSLSGGDFKLGGDLTVSNGLNLVHHDRTVWFIGSAIQSISETSLSLLQLGGMSIQNGSNNVMLNCGVEIADTLWMFGGNVMTDVNYIKIDSTGTVERTSGAVIGNLEKEFPVGANISKRFEVSSGSTYTPIDVTFANISNSGYLTVHVDSLGPALAGSLINPLKKVSKFWTVSDNGIAFDTYDVIFNFTPTDVDSGSDFNKFIIGRTFDAVWSTPVVGTKTDSSTQMVGSHLFGTFAVGEIQTNTIIATASANGTISPNGVVTVNIGDTATFTFLPNTGFHIDSLIVDGIANYDSIYISQYTFVNVTTSHTIAAYFSINSYPIISYVTGNGNLTPSGTSWVNHGDSIVYTIRANNGNHIDSILIDTPLLLSNVMAVKNNHSKSFYQNRKSLKSGNVKTMMDMLIVILGTGNDDTLRTYSFTNVMTNHTIDAFFSINKYTISANLFGNGIITPVGDSTVIYGDSIAYSISPNIYNHIDSVVVDGINIGKQASYTFHTVSSNHSISAYVSLNLNIAPIFTSVLSDTAIARFDTLHFQYQAFDPDSGKISYSLLNPLSGASIDSTGLLTFIPDANANGIYSTVVQVKDDSSAVVNDTAKIRVNIYGDVSGNGSVSSYDASLILRHVVGIDTLQPLQIRIADVSGNNSLSSLDASYILQYSVGLISSFPGGLGKHQQADVVLSAFSFRIEKSKEADEYDLYISVNKPSQVYGVIMDLGFDSTIVTPKLFAKTAITDSMLMATKFYTDQVKLAIAGIYPLIKAGDVIKFTFTLKNPNYPKNALLFTMKKFILNETDHTNEIGGITLNVRDLAQLPTVYKLEQNFPNPFNPTTTINYQLPDVSTVTIGIYNVLGQEVKMLIHEQQIAGYYSMVWNGTDNTNRKISSGVYIYRIEATGLQQKRFSEVKKMLMIK